MRQTTVLFSCTMTPTCSSFPSRLRINLVQILYPEWASQVREAADISAILWYALPAGHSVLNAFLYTHPPRETHANKILPVLEHQDFLVLYSFSFKIFNLEIATPALTSAVYLQPHYHDYSSYTGPSDCLHSLQYCSNLQLLSREQKASQSRPFPLSKWKGPSNVQRFSDRIFNFEHQRLWFNCWPCF